MSKAVAVHEAVLRRLRNNTDSEEIDFLTRPDDVVLPALFLNYRNGRGLRLTIFGLKLLEPLAVHYEIPLISARACDMARLETRLTMPYFVDRKRIVLFEEESAVLLRLTNGDLSTFVQIT